MGVGENEWIIVGSDRDGSECGSYGFMYIFIWYIVIFWVLILPVLLVPYTYISCE